MPTDKIIVYKDKIKKKKTIFIHLQLNFEVHTT